MATAQFGLSLGAAALDFEAELAPERWNGFPVPLVAHDYAVQIAEAVGDPAPESYDGLRPYDGLQWEISGRPVFLSGDDVRQLIEALDSHIYWQLSDKDYRSNGDVLDPGSDTPEDAEQIATCRLLQDRLERAVA